MRAFPTLGANIRLSSADRVGELWGPGGVEDKRARFITGKANDLIRRLSSQETKATYSREGEVIPGQ